MKRLGKNMKIKSCDIMPYIPQDERTDIECMLTSLKAQLGISDDLPVGKLNYIISTLISHLIEIHGTSYTIGNNLIGVFSKGIKHDSLLMIFLIIVVWGVAQEKKIDVEIMAIMIDKNIMGIIVCCKSIFFCFGSII